jgi:hypothetical protein
MHRDVIVEPYQIAINAEPVFDAIKPAQVNAYQASAVISRIDGGAVVGNFLRDLIPVGGQYLNLKSALDDYERMARLRIANGFID